MLFHDLQHYYKKDTFCKFSLDLKKGRSTSKSEKTYDVTTDKRFFRELLPLQAVMPQFEDTTSLNSCCLFVT